VESQIGIDLRASAVDLLFLLAWIAPGQARFFYGIGLGEASAPLRFMRCRWP